MMLRLSLLLLLLLPLLLQLLLPSGDLEAARRVGARVAW